MWSDVQGDATLCAFIVCTRGNNLINWVIQVTDMCDFT